MFDPYETTVDSDCFLTNYHLIKVCNKKNQAPKLVLKFSKVLILAILQF